MLHYTALNYTTLHYIISHNITSHYNTHYITSHHITPHHTPLHRITPHHIISSHLSFSLWAQRTAVYCRPQLIVVHTRLYAQFHEKILHNSSKKMLISRKPQSKECVFSTYNSMSLWL